MNISWGVFRLCKSDFPVLFVELTRLPVLRIAAHTFYHPQISRAPHIVLRHYMSSRVERWRQVPHQGPYSSPSSLGGLLIGLQTFSCWLYWYKVYKTQCIYEAHLWRLFPTPRKMESKSWAAMTSEEKYKTMGSWFFGPKGENHALMLKNFTSIVHNVRAGRMQYFPDDPVGSSLLFPHYLILILVLRSPSLLRWSSPRNSTIALKICL